MIWIPIITAALATVSSETTSLEDADLEACNALRRKYKLPEIPPADEVELIEALGIWGFPNPFEDFWCNIDIYENKHYENHLCIDCYIMKNDGDPELWSFKTYTHRTTVPESGIIKKLKEIVKEIRTMRLHYDYDRLWRPQWGSKP